MNQNEEIRLFKRFIKILEPNNNWEFEPRDKPDFELILPKKTIGVEITEILDQERRSRQMLLRQIGELVVSDLDQKALKPFHLNLSFQPGLRIKKSDISDYAKAIADQIYRLIGPSPSKETYQFDFDATSTNGFTGFTILFSKALTKSYFSESATGFVPNFSKEEFSEIILKKNEALKSYHPYDEQWLVIAEGNFLAGSVDRLETVSDSTKSEFDRIFVFRQQTQEIIKIKTQHNRVDGRTS